MTGRYLRLTASRPVYRRGGVELSTTPRDFTAAEGEALPFEPAQLLAILLDPVIQIAVSEDGETFAKLPPEERAEGVKHLLTLAEAENAEVANVDLDKLPIDQAVKDAAQNKPEEIAEKLKAETANSDKAGGGAGSSPAPAATSDKRGAGKPKP